ncbi:cytokine receptor family member b1 [Pseudorasbora parva]|uniref:cytokine receptor family member b1 n=1 Tax=Pseudorasbora parva TaxID=51549 RepID=UPI00351F0F74
MTTAHVGRLFLVSLYITVLHTIPAPANLTIVSHNFRHILQWSPGIGSPPGTVFNIRQRCRNSSRNSSTPLLKIRNTTVDVSQTMDIYDSCTFTVWASQDRKKSEKVTRNITPYEYTILGPPIVVLSGCGGCLNISISLPFETTMTNELRQFYNSLSFNISWKKAEKNEVEHISISSSHTHHVLKNLQPGHQYCVSVRPQTSTNPNTRPSAWQCEYTSEEEPRGGLYLVGWSLGAAVAGVGVLVLVSSLVYTRSLCKPKNPLPKSLSNIVQAHYLIHEQTLYDIVSSTEAKLTCASKNYPSKNNKSPNVGYSENRQHEENYANKADTDDEEDYDEEDKGNYMGCVIDNSGPETNKSKAKAVVSTLPLHNSSGIDRAKEAAVEEIHHDELECKNDFIPGVFEDRNQNPHIETKGKEDGSGNINLFSVTLRALGPEEEEEEVCKPLLVKLIPELSTSDTSAPEEQPEEEILQEAKEMDIQTEMKSDEEVDTTSGYMVTHTGNIYDEHNRSSSEELDCDTDYITR